MISIRLEPLKEKSKRKPYKLYCFIVLFKSPTTYDLILWALFPNNLNCSSLQLMWTRLYMTNLIGLLKGRENFVSFMKAKQGNNEWKSDLKEAIRRYEAADRLCTAATKTKRFYLLKSKIFKERLGDSSTQVPLVTTEICLRWYIQTYKDNIHL